jgi:putative heme-binding domain-containing protein
VQALARTRSHEVATLLLDRYHQVSPASQQVILDSLLSRPQWANTMLDRIAAGSLRANVLNADRRAKLLAHPDAELRHRAGQLLGDRAGDRQKALAAYRPALKLTGNAERGRESFRKLCSTCHKLQGHGHEVGPALDGLTNRDPQWLLTAMIDPNRDLDARYVAFSALTDDGRVVSGIVVAESATTLTLRESGGKEHQLLREEIDQIRGGGVSLMPEGLEKDLAPQDVSDLIAYVTQSISAKPSPAASGDPSDDTLPRYAADIAPFLLDDSQSTERRQRVIDLRPGMGPAIVAWLATDLRKRNGVDPGADRSPHDSPRPEQHIPWIWRVSLAVGRRNDGGEIRDLLEQSLPSENGTLEHWQAVAVGGGIINGLTQVGQWPRQRIEPILQGTASLRPRWNRALELAAVMADDSQVRPGTRYDALRMVALAKPATAIPHLKRYLTNDADRQLQMGAVSGLADIDQPQVTGPLLESLSFLKDRNRQLAVEALLRNPQRSDALLQAMTDTPAIVSRQQLVSLLDHVHSPTADNAKRILDAISTASVDDR